MNYPPTPDFPRIRCCNCTSWQQGSSLIFGTCTTHRTTCYVNGACSEWRWNATA